MGLSEGGTRPSEWVSVRGAPGPLSGSQDLVLRLWGPTGMTSGGTVDREGRRCVRGGRPG